jgi:hypothetical protein
METQESEASPSALAGLIYAGALLRFRGTSEKDNFADVTGAPAPMGKQASPVHASETPRSGRSPRAPAASARTTAFAGESS